MHVVKFKTQLYFLLFFIQHFRKKFQKQKIVVGNLKMLVLCTLSIISDMILTYAHKNPTVQTVNTIHLLHYVKFGCLFVEELHVYTAGCSLLGGYIRLHAIAVNRLITTQLDLTIWALNQQHLTQMSSSGRKYTAQ